MANTYTQLYVHLIFAVHRRDRLIKESVRERVQQYICGIVRDHRHKPLAVYCMPDHLHLLVGLHPDQSIADLVREIKGSSSTWINANHLLPTHFAWQRGYGAFSYAKSQLDAVVQYIQRQPEHHARTSFRDEYTALLQKFTIEYDEKYLFEWIE